MSHIVRLGDVAQINPHFAKVPPFMGNGKMPLALGLTNGMSFGSSKFNELRHSDQVGAKNLHHLVSSQAFLIVTVGNMTRGLYLRHVPAAFLSNAHLPLVQLTEQPQIVAEFDSHLSIICGVESKDDISLHRAGDESISSLEIYLDEL